MHSEVRARLVGKIVTCRSRKGNPQCPWANMNDHEVCQHVNQMSVEDARILYQEWDENEGNCPIKLADKIYDLAHRIGHDRAS